MGRKQDLAKRVNALVEEALGDKVICSHCGATLDTFADKCRVSLDAICEGFEAVDRAKCNARAEVYGSRL